ncbi:MAG: metal ABC transporter substrate-binding protein [Parvibaculum sp.]|uniref:metal ABC transporter substrate-binding protein n=1 Tax=Parvibaculum sp. TaxID=2024848 RepID=UPI002AB850E8|nr:metal ABC transporter substrate-binding protein [Parvibaculum sp.]MDZ4380120.1 metal ABC transporter substrate-binding protein [Parvibaculum sp.]
MKNLVTHCLVLALALIIAQPARATEPVKVVASFSILGDMVRNVAGSNADVTVLVGPDGDTHSFEPGPAHASALADADLLVLNGLGFEPWLIRLAAASGTKAKYVTASFGVSPRHLSAAERRRDEDGHGHDEDGYPEAARDFDPHAWQDLRNGITYVQNIAGALAEKDPDNALVYRANAESYILELKKLDQWVRSELAKLPKEKRKVITTHDAFGYFGNAYGVEFISPLGIGSMAEPSAQALARLVDQVRREKIRALFIENMSDPRMMETIARETGAEDGGTLYSDALSPAGGPAPTYAAMFRHNVPALIAAMQKN